MGDIQQFEFASESAFAACNSSTHMLKYRYMNTRPLIPTTVRLHPALLHRLKAFSEERGKTLSEIIELSVSRLIEQQEKDRLKQMYKGLFELAGMCKEPITDASSSIDEILYGENGAWKGSNE